MHRGQSQQNVSEISSNTSISQRFTRPPVIGPLTFGDSVLTSKWKKEDSSSSVYSFDGPLPGPVRPVDGSTQANNLFLRNEAIALVVEETNRYASQCRSECSSPTQRPWHDITCDEIKAFFGTLFCMGIARFPHWSCTGPRNMTWLDNICDWLWEKGHIRAYFQNRVIGTAG